MFYFHGLPGSRLEAELAGECAAKQRVRLIAVDRPGFGFSDTFSDRSLLDWPADVAYLADQLALSRFSAIGVSGGGPYAAACAFALPERLVGVGIVSGVGPLDRKGMIDAMPWFNRFAITSAQRFPWFTGKLLQIAPVLSRCPTNAIDVLRHLLGDPDNKVLARPRVRETLARSLAESLRQGASGIHDDLLILLEPWGFLLKDIGCVVHLWHGGKDHVVPLAHGRRLGLEIPGAKSTFLPQEGHFSLVIDHVSEIFRAISSSETDRR